MGYGHLVRTRGSCPYVRGSCIRTQKWRHVRRREVDRPYRTHAGMLRAGLRSETTHVVRRDGWTDRRTDVPGGCDFDWLARALSHSTLRGHLPRTRLGWALLRREVASCSRREMYLKRVRFPLPTACVRIHRMWASLYDYAKRHLVRTPKSRLYARGERDG